MYQVYIDKPSFYDVELLGEYKNLDDAVKNAEQAKKEDSEITYTIEETNGSFNSYGEQTSVVVKRG